MLRAAFLVFFLFCNGAMAANSISETSWQGKDLWGRPIVLYFSGDGRLAYKTGNGIFTDGTWQQNDDNVYLEINKKFVEQRGVLKDDELTGDGVTQRGYKGSWSVKRLSSNPPDLTAAAASPKPVAAVAGGSLTKEELQGTYEGTVKFDSSALTIRLRFSEEDNFIETRSTPGASQQQNGPQRITTLSQVPDWEGIQRATQYAKRNRASASGNKEYSAILKNLQPFLESNSVVDRCVDLNYGGAGTSLLCRPTNNPWPEPSLLLFTATLSQCGNGFCGYVIYPLFKK